MAKTLAMEGWVNNPHSISGAEKPRSSLETGGVCEGTVNGILQVFSRYSLQLMIKHIKPRDIPYFL
jgi:uncharacterized membrane protein YkvI